MAEKPQIRGRIDLRIMATTDLHMHVLGYDYFADRPAAHLGLSRVAALIERARNAAPNHLLLDNGDSLQGSPMGDFLAATQRAQPHRPHPAIQAMNALRYDAATLGNHDFSFGPEFLRRALSGAGFPLVGTNLRSRRPLPVAPHLLLERRFRDEFGAEHGLRIGLLGFLPPQTVDWEPELARQITVLDILETARAGIARLRALGADLVIVLSHSGIGALAPAPRLENAATALAALPGIDALIAGHTHRVFPSAEHPPGPGIDIHRGTLAGKPAVMPGFWGSHLGIIDLRLEPHDAGWRVADFACRAEPVAEQPATEQADHPAVTAPSLGAHRQTLRHFRRRIGRSARPLNSHFALLGQDAGLRLVMMAQRWHVRRMLRTSRWQHLPILSAAAPFRAGGRGGPQHYTDIPAGQLSLRSIADLYLFPNRICAVVLTGAGIRDWLERAASLFLRIDPGRADQPLIDPEFPSYNFDLIDGLDWRIDLSRPARHAPDGSLTGAGPGRIASLGFRGRPVTPEQQFVLATNSYRLSGSGLYAPVVAGRPVALDSASPTREVLRRYVAQRRVLAPEPGIGLGFCPLPGTSVLFDTGPGARPHLPDLPARAEPLGIGPEGFLRLRLHL